MKFPSFRKRKSLIESPGIFFIKQFLLFISFAFVILVIDLFLYAFIAIDEGSSAYRNGTPISIMREMDSALTQQSDDEYVFSDEGLQALSKNDAWSMLLNNEGQVIWSSNLPNEVPTSYSLNEIALFSHYATIEDYPVFLWDRTDGLLILGFPQDSYSNYNVNYPTSIIINIPLYILFVTTLDALLLFLLYAITRRKTQRAIDPIVEALDSLALGQPTQIKLSGDLKVVGKRISQTSELLEQKDTARANWISGVSHDIRTPLSLVLGFASDIENNKETPDESRRKARVIREQSMRIKNLVTDLNIASRLDYTSNPLQIESFSLPRLLREVVASYINSHDDTCHEIILTIDEDLESVYISGDPRLLSRAIENAINNSWIHNEAGCITSINLEHRADVVQEKEPRIIITISDDGTGVTFGKLNELQMQINQSRLTYTTNGIYEKEHGLGLVLIDKIAQAHQGYLDISSSSEKGFVARIILPSQNH